jgi:hypothetical protein
VEQVYGVRGSSKSALDRRLGQRHRGAVVDDGTGHGSYVIAVACARKCDEEASVFKK